MADSKKRLVLEIDASKAKQGADEAKKAAGEITKAAEKSVTALERLSTQINSLNKTFDQLKTGLVQSSFDSFRTSMINSRDSMQELQKLSKSFSSELQQSLKTVNSNIDGLSRKVDNVTTSFDKTIEKQRLFRKDISDTTRALSTLQKSSTGFAEKIATSFGNLNEKTKETQTAFNNVRTEVNTLGKRIDSLDGHVKNARDNFRELNTPLKKTAGFIDDMNLKTIDASYAMGDLRKNVNSINAPLGQFATKADKAVGSTQKFREQMVKAQKEFTTLKGATGDLTEQIDRTDKKMKNLGSSFTELSRAMGSATKALDQAVERQNRLQKELDQTKKKMEATSQTTRRFSAEFMALSTVVSGFSMVMFLQELGRTTDAYKNLQNRIAVVTGTTEGMTEVTRELLEVSQEARTSIDATADVYAKITRVNEQYNLSQRELLDITTAVSQAVSMSGATAQGAQGAMIQFAQALQNNFAAAAQEMNSLIEQTPALAELVADAMNAAEGVTTYTMGNIKRAATDGFLEVEKVLKGILLVTDDYAERFQLSQVLLSQGWQQLKNSFTVYLGELDAGTGVTKELAEGMMDLARNFDEFESVVAGAAAALGTLLALATSAGFAAIGALLGTSGIIVAGISAIVGGLVYLGVELKNVLSDVEEFGRTFDETVINIAESTVDFFTNNLVFSVSDGIDSTIETFVDFGTWHRDFWYDIFDFISGIVDSVVDYFRESFTGQVISKIFDIMRRTVAAGILGVVDSMIKEFTWGLNFMGARIAEWANEIADTLNIETQFGWSGISGVTVVTDLVNQEVDAVNHLRGELDVLISKRRDQIEIERILNEILGEKTEILDENNSAIKESIKLTEDEAEALQDILEEADPLLTTQREMREAYDLLMKAVSSKNITLKQADKTFTALALSITGANDELEDLRDTYSDILNELDPTLEVTEKMAEAEKALTQAVADGKINLEDKDNILTRYRSTIDGTADSMRDLSETITDTFMDGLDAAMDGMDSFTDFFKSWLKDLAMTAIRNKIVVPITNQILGVNAQGQPVSGQGVGFGDIIGTVGSAFNSTGSSLSAGFNSFATSNFGASLGLSTATSGAQMASQYGLTTGVAGGANLMTGAGEFISQGLQYSPWGAVGSIGASLLGINGSGNMLLDTAASTAGSIAGGSIGSSIATLGAFGGPVGAALGAIAGTALAGLFEKKPSNKEGRATIDLSNGQINIGGQEGEKFSQENRDAANALTQAAGLMASTFGVSGGNIMTGVGGRDPFSFAYQDAAGTVYANRGAAAKNLTGSRNIDVEALPLTRNMDEFTDAMTEFFAELGEFDLEPFREFKNENELFIETIIRLKTQVSAVQHAAKIMGMSFEGTEVQLLTYADSITAFAGGVDRFSVSFDAYYQNFYSAQERFVNFASDLTEIFSDLSVDLPTTVEGFRNIVEGLDLTNEVDQELYATLLNLNPQVKEYINGLNDIESQIRSFTDATLSEDAINYFVNAVSKGYKTLDEVSGILSGVSGDVYLNDLEILEKQQEMINQIDSFINGLRLSELSTLSPQARTQVAAGTYRQLYTSVASGNVDDYADLERAAQDYLSELRNSATSRFEYERVFNSVLSDLTSISGTSVGGSNDPITNIVGVSQAILDSYQSILGRTADEAGAYFYQALLDQGTDIEDIQMALRNSPEYIDGSHANGLSYVPYDGYIAELHRGEAVVTASDNATNKVTVEELKAIREELVYLRAEVRADVNHNAKTAKLLDRVIPDGRTVSVTVEE